MCDIIYMSSKSKSKSYTDTLLKKRCVTKIARCIGLDPKLPQYKEQRTNIINAVKKIKVQKHQPNPPLTKKQIDRKKQMADYYQKNKDALIKKQTAYNKTRKPEINAQRRALYAVKKSKGLV